MIYNCPPLLKQKRLIVLDIETTGLSLDFNTIIELGVVEVVNGEINTQYSRVFGGGRSPIYLVRNVHHIKDTERRGKKTFGECSTKVASFLDGATLVTHNGLKFDIPFLEARLKENGLELNYERHYDTYMLAKKLKFEHHSLNWLCGNYKIPYGAENHRGLTDCLCTLQLLYAMCEQFGEEEILA